MTRPGIITIIIVLKEKQDGFIFETMNEISRKSFENKIAPINEIFLLGTFLP
jgi:hypothetical protein